MKVALCLSGQPRFVEYTYQKIKENIIDPNNADVFIHTWYDKDLIGKNFTDYNASGWNYNSTNSKYKENIDLIINEVYKPKKMIAEKEKNFYDDNLKIEKTINKHAQHYSKKYFSKMLYSSWYSILKSNTLKEEYRLENDIKYDYVIRARFDCQLNRKLNCSNYDPNFLYTDRRPDFPIHRMIEDWFAFGSNKIMNIYSSSFNLMNYADDKSSEEDGIFCSETLVYETMKVFKIEHVPLKDLLHVPFRQNMIIE